jgi:hypothetical protein
MWQPSYIFGVEPALRAGDFGIAADDGLPSRENSRRSVKLVLRASRTVTKGTEPASATPVKNPGARRSEAPQEKHKARDCSGSSGKFFLLFSRHLITSSKSLTEPPERAARELFGVGSDEEDGVEKV